MSPRGALDLLLICDTIQMMTSRSGVLSYPAARRDYHVFFCLCSSIESNFIDTGAAAAAANPKTDIRSQSICTKQHEINPR